MGRAARSIAGSAIVTGLVLATGLPAFAATVTQVPVQSTGFFGGLLGVDPVTASDGWAVGGNGNGVVQRFDGTRWSVFPSPDLLAGDPNGWADLTGVDATSASTAFAVGNSTAGSGGAKTAVALRWNGSAWSRQAVPKVAGTDTEFGAVRAFSASDAWAVGQTASTNSTFRKTLAMHYNGSAWSAVPTPSPGTRTNFVTAVDGATSGDVWAVGHSLNLPYGNRVRQSLILHWNGAAWTQVASPSNGSTYLYDVVALSASDAWAVGSASGQAFVTRWDGTAWTAVAAPPLANLRGITARSATDVWVAGSDSAGVPGPRPLERHELVGHTADRQWRRGHSGADGCNGRGRRRGVGGGCSVRRHDWAVVRDRFPRERITSGGFAGAMRVRARRERRARCPLDRALPAESHCRLQGRPEPASARAVRGSHDFHEHRSLIRRDEQQDDNQRQHGGDQLDDHDEGDEGSDGQSKHCALLQRIDTEMERISAIPGRRTGS